MSKSIQPRVHIRHKAGLRTLCGEEIGYLTVAELGDPPTEMDAVCEVAIRRGLSCCEDCVNHVSRL